MSNDNRIQLVTPVGRIIQGDCFAFRDTDQKGNPLLIKNGPNAGQPRKDYYIMLAIEKNNPDWPAFEQQIWTVARTGFPNLFDINTGASLRQDFAFKYEDGDSQRVMQNNKRPCDIEGAPGHWLVRFSSGIEPQCYSRGGTEVLKEPSSIKRGYFVRVYATIAPNGDQSRPGLYLNHNMIELMGYGPEIVGGPDATQVFGGSPTSHTPAGMTTSPPAPATGISQPNLPPQAAAPAGMPPQAAAPAGIPPQAAAPAGMPPQAAAPAGMPPQAAAPAGMPPQAAAPAAPVGVPPQAAAPPQGDYLKPTVYVCKGTRYTEDQLIAAGWTIDQIKALPTA